MSQVPYRLRYAARRVKHVVGRSACLVVAPVAVDSFAFLFVCVPVGRVSGWIDELYSSVWAGLLLVQCLVVRGSAGGFAPVFRWWCWRPGVL